MAISILAISLALAIGFAVTRTAHDPRPTQE